MTQRRNGRTASFKLFKALMLFSLPLVLTCVLTNQVSHEVEPTYQGQSLQIEFTKFSPAYAAFEDEFLFEEEVSHPALNAGESNSFFVSQTETLHVVEKDVQNQVVQKEEVEFETFSGLASLANPIVKEQSVRPAPEEIKKVQELGIEDEGEFTPEFKLNFGPMIASLPKDQSKFIAGQKRVKKPTARPTPSSDKIFEEKALKPKYYNVTGPIELREGLAFVGSMEVSWVIDDQEVRVGAINTPDGTYEIRVNDLIGDIIVSLYDENDELIGEGVANLDQIESTEQLNSLKINIRPIDWDKAGEVIHVHSLNSHDRPIQGAEVLLYAYNDAMETNDEGEIRFADWKKSNSRTLALASKDGYRDSVFLIDSKKESKVLLFEDKYMDAFFSWIEDLGIYGVDEMGTIYGSIVNGRKSQSGYEVSIGKIEPLYFNEAYFASNKQKATASNGLFAFTGLGDGDYELLIEKDGVIVDRRIVPVEQGKVSPLLIDVKRKKKRLEFFDPHNEEVVPTVAVQFFDGEESLELDEKGQVLSRVVGGSDPNLIDYANADGYVASTFISRQRGFERVAVLNKEHIDKLISDNDFEESNGLAIGYIKSEIPYEVYLEESSYQNVIYFDAFGKEIDPTTAPAFGFMIHGFNQGLHTLSVQTVEDNILAMTDLIFSDHQSISVIHSAIESL